ncbi:hypothetical protein NIES4103_05530 [Nostoc sp. NIES-4103]|nr:hypothetical protein NIES4103_05530 [Nostoc sp. NIES-4103]
MKILISISDLSTGGAQTFAVRLANALSVRHSIYIYNYELTEKHHESVLPQKITSDVKLIYMPKLLSWVFTKIDNRLYRLKFKPKVLDFFKKLQFKIAVLLIYRVDVINTHLYHSDNFVVSLLEKYKIPIIMSDHGDYRFVIETGISTLDEVTKIMNRVDGIVYPSRSNLQVISKYINNYDKPIEKTIYYGNSHEDRKINSQSAREKLGISANTIVFGMVARGIPDKGWAEAIQAFEDIHCRSNKKVNLILVGESEYISSLKESLKPELMPVVHFTGYSSEPNYWIESFDVGLLPTYFPGESLPNSIIEYLYLGKPVIATEVGGIPEMLTHEGQTAGFMINLTANGKADVSTMTEKMLSYINDTNLLKEHSCLAKQASNKFQMQTCVEAYESLFKQTLKSEF